MTVTVSGLDRPATRNQVGALHAQFRRLGFGEPAWRGARLAVAAALTGEPDLSSLGDLSGGGGQAYAQRQQPAPRVVHGRLVQRPPD